jgi:hypothetical protein
MRHANVACRCDERCHSVPPFVGREQERGKQQAQLRFHINDPQMLMQCCGPLFPSLCRSESLALGVCCHPLPVPPHKGEGTVGLHLRNSRSAFADRFQRLFMPWRLRRDDNERTGPTSSLPADRRVAARQQARVVRTEAQRTVTIAAKQPAHAACDVAVIDAKVRASLRQIAQACPARPDRAIVCQREPIVRARSASR